MSQYKPYPAYKDSGVEWIGEVPEGWRVCKLKYYGRLKGGVGFSPEFQGNPSNEIAFYKVSDLAKSEDGINLGTTGNTITNDQAKTLGGTVFGPGTLVWAKIGAALSLNRRRVIQQPCCIDNNMTGFVVDGNVASIKYSHYLMTVVDFSIHAKPGAVPSFSEGDQGDLSVPCPPKKEQDAIVVRLDRETARIDALISKKTCFIELLKEKRSALISHAVTKGLDPNVKMKDSGVEWLGMVPDGWEVWAIKHIVSTPVTDGPHETPNFPDEGIPFVSAEAVSSGKIDFAKIRGFISEADHFRYSEKYRPQRGDIYMVKSGATTGVTAIVETDIEFNIWSPLAVIRCGGKAAPRFVLNFMRSKNFQETVTLNWNFGTQQNIGMGVIENLSVTVPPLEEQHKIATFLDCETTKIDALIGRSEKSITLAQERRSALISAAVTGKIDVRKEMK